MNNIVTLDEVCIGKSSNLAQKDIKEINGEYPVYGASGYISNVDFYHQEKEYLGVVKDGAGIGRTMFLPAKSSVIGTIQYLIPKDNILPKYLYYAVTGMNLSRLYTGSTIPHIYFKDYKKESFPLPSIKKQTDISELLEKTEKIIEFKKTQLNEYDQLIKSRFVEMFGDEKNVVKLEEICTKITDGSHNPPKGIEYSENYMLSSKNIQDRKISLESPRYLSDEDFHRESKRTQIQAGDVLLTIVGTIGRTAVVPENFRNLTLQRSVSVLHPNYEKTTSTYLEQALVSIRQIIEGEANGVAQKGIYLKQVRNLSIKLPSLKRQQIFESFVQQVDKLKSAVQKSLDETQALFDSLMQEYFG